MHVTADQIPLTPLLISVKAAAAYLGISERKAWYLIEGGELPSCRVGARRYVPRHELIAYFERLATGEAA